MLIPAAERSSTRRASQMACPALGLEVLQPLQPEPPPEPAFAEAQKWIEVGAATGGAALQGRPKLLPREQRPQVQPSPTFVASFPRSSSAAFGRLRSLGVGALGWWA